MGFGRAGWEFRTSYATITSRWIVTNNRRGAWWKNFLTASRSDFLFIDGDHTVEGVTKDFLLYRPLVRKGGVIAFHDILNPRRNAIRITSA